MPAKPTPTRTTSTRSPVRAKAPITTANAASAGFAVPKGDSVQAAPIAFRAGQPVRLRSLNGCTARVVRAITSKAGETQYEVKLIDVSGNEIGSATCAAGDLVRDASARAMKLKSATNLAAKAAPKDALRIVSAMDRVVTGILKGGRDALDVQIATRETAFLQAMTRRLIALHAGHDKEAARYMKLLENVTSNMSQTTGYTTRAGYAQQAQALLAQIAESLLSAASTRAMKLKKAGGKSAVAKSASRKAIPDADRLRPYYALLAADAARFRRDPRAADLTEFGVIGRKLQTLARTLARGGDGIARVGASLLRVPLLMKRARDLSGTPQEKRYYGEIATLVESAVSGVNAVMRAPMQLPEGKPYALPRSVRKTATGNPRAKTNNAPKSRVTRLKP